MRYFNSASLTELLPGIHDMKDAVELPDDNWFFTMQEIPKGKQLAKNKDGEPILIDIIQERAAS